MVAAKSPGAVLAVLAVSPASLPFPFRPRCLLPQGRVRPCRSPGQLRGAGPGARRRTVSGGTSVFAMVLRPSGARDWAAASGDRTVRHLTGCRQHLRRRGAAALRRGRRGRPSDSPMPALSRPAALPVSHLGACKGRTTSRDVEATPSSSRSPFAASGARTEPRSNSHGTVMSDLMWLAASGRSEPVVVRVPSRVPRRWCAKYRGSWDMPMSPQQSPSLRPPVALRLKDWGSECMGSMHLVAVAFSTVILATHVP